MPRYKLTLEYDGEPFVGWQRQDTGPSVQAALEDAVFAFSGERVTVHGAGRTDSGVHARGQVAHVDLAEDKPVETIRSALNFHLKPNPVAVLLAEPVAADFHARFSAVWRRYRYRILNRRAPPALDRGQLWHLGVPLDAAAMADAATVLVGRHDFNSFRSTSCQAPSAVKTLDLLEVGRDGEEIQSRSAPDRSCTIRCASWSVPCSSWVAANGAAPMSSRRWPHAIVRAPAPQPRRKASASWRCATVKVGRAQAPVIGTMPRKRSTISDRKRDGTQFTSSSAKACSQLAFSTDRVTARNQ